MYNDLADAVEYYKEHGFTHVFEIEGNKIICKDLNVSYFPNDIKIMESYRHERMTDPGTDETVYALKSSSGIKGILVAAYGMYVEPWKAELIDSLLSHQDYNDK